MFPVRKPRSGRRPIAALVALAMMAGALAWAGGPVAADEGDVVVSDSFTRTDGPLDSAETGQPWVTHSGAPGVSAGAAVAGPGYALATVDSGLASAVVSATVTNLGTEFWLVPRLADSSNYWRFGRVAGGDYVLQQVVNNGLGAPALNVQATVTPETGDVVSCTASTTNLSCAVDGVVVVETSSSFIREATRHGFGAWDSPTATFDEYTVVDGPPPPPPPPPPPSPPEGALVYDSFTRVDGPLGSAETGQSWTAHHGQPSVSALAAVPGDGYGLVTADAGASNGVVSAVVTSLGSEFWLVPRLVDGNNYWRFGRVAGGPYVLQQVVNNGLGHPSIQVLATVLPEAGDVLTCSLTSTSLGCSVDGVTVVQTNDAFNRTATRHGLGTWQSPGVSFDEFTVSELPQIPDILVGLTGNKSVETSAPITLTATVTSDGVGAAEQVMVEGALPEGLSNVALATSSGSCALLGSTFSCELGDMVPGSDASIVITANAPTTAGTIVTTVAATHSDPDAHPSDDQASLTTRVRTPAPPGATVIDSFDRPSDADGTLGVADSGQEWVTHQGAFQIADGEAEPATSNMSITSLDAGFAHGTYEVTVTEGAANFWLALRVIDSNNYYRVGPDPWNGIYRLSKVVGGVEQQMYANFTREWVQAQDGDVIRVVTRPDDSIYVYVNGEHIIDSGDQQFLGETGFGLITNGAAPRFDHLVISSVVQGMPVSDTFTRPNTTAGLGTPEEGIRIPWRVWRGGPWGIWDNQARATWSGYNLIGTDASSELATVSVRFASLTGQQWLVFRFAEDGSYYRCGGTGTGKYNIRYVRPDGTNVVPPVPLQKFSPPVLQAGDVVQVVQSPDGTVECRVNGITRLRMVDPTTNRTATIYGMATNGTAARFDDFLVTPPS
jgi:hypothetical protein